MANLTISVDDEVLQRARIRALEQGTSVNALLRAYLEAFADADARRRSAAREVLEIADEVGTGAGGRRWSRDDLHER